MTTPYFQKPMNGGSGLDREAQTARTRVFRVRVRNLELAAKQVLFPIKLGTAKIGHALRVHEDLDALLGDDEVGRAGCVREVHAVLHATASAGNDPESEGRSRSALLVLEGPNATDRGLGDNGELG